jgi:hypothetical protein
LIESSEVTQKRCLAAATGTQKEKQFTGTDRQLDVVKCKKTAKSFGKSLDSNHAPLDFSARISLNRD